MKKSDSTPIGAHVSIKNGYSGAYIEALALNATALQLFAKSPMQAKLREVTASEALEVSRLIDRDKIKYSVIHASYLLNFAKKLSKDAYEMKSIIEDLKNAEMLGADGAILHMGKATNGRDLGMALFVDNCVEILKKTSGMKSHLILENTAGQGTELGFNFAEYGELFSAIKKKAGADGNRLRMCLDTAHAFAGGYDLRNKDSIKKTIIDLDKFIGINNISCIHFNDSKKPLDSRVDRHEDIGHGNIGSTGLRTFVQEIANYTGKNIPLILETPQEHSTYSDQLNLMKKWVKK